MQKSYCYTPGVSIRVGVRVHMQNVKANVKVLEFKSSCIFSCIAYHTNNFKSPLQQKLTTGAHPVTVAPLVVLVPLGLWLTDTFKFWISPAGSRVIILIKLDKKKGLFVLQMVNICVLGKNWNRLSSDWVTHNKFLNICAVSLRWTIYM